MVVSREKEASSLIAARTRTVNQSSAIVTDIDIGSGFGSFVYLIYFDRRVWVDLFSVSAGGDRTRQLQVAKHRGS